MADSRRAISFPQMDFEILESDIGTAHDAPTRGKLQHFPPPLRVENVQNPGFLTPLSVRIVNAYRRAPSGPTNEVLIPWAIRGELNSDGIHFATYGFIDV